jgi:dTDP-4-amino-4,6-dideoxygalactose transaminase
VAGAVEAAVARVVASGWYILGEEVAAFEREFAAFLGAGHVVGVGSGTEALHLALAACGVRPGDDVVTVPNTAVATVAAIEAAGAVPRFADVDSETLLLDPAALESAITPKTRAVIPVHLHGQAAAMPDILAIARGRGLRVVEDAAQSAGTRLGGRHTGTFGDVGCFSFYPSKNLGAIGDGGAVCTDDPDLAERLRLLRQYGWAERDRSVLPGFNSRLDEIQAAVLRAKLPRLDERNARRRAIAGRYREALADCGIGLPAASLDERWNVHLFVVRHPDRDAFRSRLAERGVGTAVHYPTPIYFQPGYAHLGIGPGACPVAERAQRQIVSIPAHPDLSDDEVERVVLAVRAAA